MLHFSGNEQSCGLRSRSKQELGARIGIVAEEADESVLRLDPVNETGVTKPELTGDLLKEVRELTATLTASQPTAKKTR